MTRLAALSFLAFATAGGLLGGCAGEANGRGARGDAVAEMAEPPGPAAMVGGEGYLVWESNRPPSGQWRIWIRGLDRSPARQLTRDEEGRQHCCPHVSPDGSAVVYLSLPDGLEGYPFEKPAIGELRLVAPDGSGERVLVPEARTYFEHRAALWHDATRLVYIDREGYTVRLDVASGATERLTAEPYPRPSGGYLVDATLSWATSGIPDFARYDRRTRTVVPQRVLGGCQPYLSHDGRWGFWIAGAGGPIHRIDLATRAIAPVIGKNDPRIPGNQGYLYFPMLSRDGLRFAFGASAGEHDNHRANYDVFVADVDPETFEVLGAPVRYTSHAATDRYPDVYSAPLALGRHFGEAPFTVRFDAKDASRQWRWRIGDTGTPAADVTAGGAVLEHTFDAPGNYAVLAADGDATTLRGSVRVRPPQPPQVVRSDLFERQLRVHFDEAIAGEPRARLGSGAAIDGARVDADGRTLVLDLRRPLAAADVLHLGGIVDRAQRPNALPETAVEIDPPLWPSRRHGLTFRWRTADRPNHVDDPIRDGVRAVELVPDGRAWYDRHHALLLAGGHYAADRDSMELVLERSKATNTFALEATITAAAATDRLATIVAFAAPHRGRMNVVLGQRGERLVFAILTSGRKDDPRREIDLGPVPIGRPLHVVVSYQPGRLAAHLDGETTLETDDVQGGFFPWRTMPLTFGNEWRADRPWHGTIEAVAMYERFVEEEEARENLRRYRAETASRPPLVPVPVRARLVAASRIPTLDDISPYTEALAVFAYTVESLAGDAARAAVAPGDTVRVVHRVMVSSETLPVARRRAGGVHRLDLEPFSAHPELESLYLSETVTGDAAAMLWFDPRVE